MKRLHLLALSLVTLALPAMGEGVLDASHTAPLGRLFFTPAERAALETHADSAPDLVYYDGFILKEFSSKKGAEKVQHWVDHALVTPESAELAKRLRPGQIYDRKTGRIYERWQLPVTDLPVKP